MNDLKYKFIAEPTVDIVLENDEFQTIFNAAAGHYDSKVQSITTVGYGGFLYGSLNRRTWAKDAHRKLDIYDKTVSVTSRQLQLMMKATEFAYGDKKVEEIGDKLRKIFFSLQDTFVTVNKQFDYATI